MQPLCYNEIMNIVMFAAIFGFLGLVFGSFAGAQVWRLRARQLCLFLSAASDDDSVSREH